MTVFEVVFEGTLARDRLGGEPPPAQWLKAFLDQVMESLVGLGAEDPAIGATGSAGHVEVTLSVLARTPEEAVALGGHLFRKAIMDAGGSIGAVEAPEIDWTETRASRAELIDA